MRDLHSITRLQQTAGNRAVVRLLRRPPRLPSPRATSTGGRHPTAFAGLIVGLGLGLASVVGLTLVILW